MRLVKTTTNRILILFLLSIILNFNSKAQDNSPYSRYGLGDLVPNTSILNRGMGGASIGFGSDRFINTSNPASYSFLDEPLTRKLDLGKAVSFEVGTEYSSRVLKQQTPIGKFTSNNLIFNYMQLGMQLNKKGNWGFTLGLQPFSRENYKIENRKRLSNIDSIQTIYDGNGGSYKLFAGTGYRIKNFSFGFNSGYFFGKKSTSTNIRLINDTIQYFESISNNKATYGKFFLQTGVLYNHIIKENDNISKTLKIGATYELQNKLKAKQDVERLVQEADETNPGAFTDSIFVQKDVAGTIVLPSTYGVGFTYQNDDKRNGKSFLVAMDYTSTAWNNYRYFGQTDQLQTNWAVKAGIQWRPESNKRYASRISYRTGVNYGKDYIKAGGNMPVYAFTFGLGLPVLSNNRFPYKDPAINLAFEAGKRGNSQNNLTENFVKISLAVSLADIWFAKRKYD